MEKNPFFTYSKLLNIKKWISEIHEMLNLVFKSTEVAINHN